MKQSKLLYHYYTIKGCSTQNKEKFQSCRSFSDEYALEKFGMGLQTSDGFYYVSDLNYSTQQTVLHKKGYIQTYS